jgi:aspartate/methionine/tyrosine aminotransferase
MQLLGCSYDPRQVGLFVWGKLPAEVVGSEALVDDLLQRAHLFLTPGFIFGSNGERFLRISLGASVEKLQEACRRVEEYLRIR